MFADDRPAGRSAAITGASTDANPDPAIPPPAAGAAVVCGAAVKSTAAEPTVDMTTAVEAVAATGTMTTMASMATVAAMTTVAPAGRGEVHGERCGAYGDGTGNGND
jgi:hypothetical protein